MAQYLVYQVWVGVEYQPLYQFCTESMARYCARHGLDHIVQRRPKLAIQPPDPSHRGFGIHRLIGYLPIFEKENAFECLRRYDGVCVVDSDIYVRQTAPNIFAELDGTSVFGAVRERDLPLRPDYVSHLRKYAESQYGAFSESGWPCTPEYGPDFYNMGVMLLDPGLLRYLDGQTPEQFIRRPEFERFVNGERPWHLSTDQTLLNYWVTTSGMPRRNLSWRWNALFRAVRDDVLPDAHFIHFFLSRRLPRRGAEIPEVVAQLEQAAAVSAPAW